MNVRAAYVVARRTSSSRSNLAQNLAKIMENFYLSGYVHYTAKLKKSTLPPSPPPERHPPLPLKVSLAAVFFILQKNCYSYVKTIKG